MACKFCYNYIQFSLISNCKQLHKLGHFANVYNRRINKSYFVPIIDQLPIQKRNNIKDS